METEGLGPGSTIDHAVRWDAESAPADLAGEPDLSFLPDGQRAIGLDRQIRSDLGASLDHLCACSAGIVPYDSVAIQRMIAGLRNGARYGPAAFGLYTDLVFALHQQDLARAGFLFNQLALLAPQHELHQILPFDDPALTSHREHFLTLMEFVAGGDGTLAAVEVEPLASFLADHHWAMDRLSCDLPELAAEIRAVVAQVILVWVPDSGDQLVFDGGSSPMLWGGLFLNVARRRTPLELLEVLVHESAHLLLYAFCQHEPLVLNDEAERYPSPLRADPRPMEGIFHATWVSARMAHAMEILSRSVDLGDALRHQALEAMKADRANFLAGEAVIRAHGQLTSTGRRLIVAATAAMGSLDGSGQ